MMKNMGTVNQIPKNQLFINVILESKLTIQFIRWNNFLQIQTKLYLKTSINIFEHAP